MNVRNEIEGFQNLYVDISEGLSNQYGWQDNDARLTIFNKCTSVLVTLNVGYLFVHKYLQSPIWWKENQVLPVKDVTMQRTSSEFESLMELSLVQFMFSSIESSFRIYVRTIDKNACEQGNCEFKSIYEYLFKRLELKEYIPLFDLWRNIRNTIHNNGLFYPKNGKDVTIEWKGVKYSFKVGKSIEFVKIDFLLLLISDTTESLVKVVKSDVLSKYTYIQD